LFYINNLILITYKKTLLLN